MAAAHASHHRLEDDNTQLGDRARPLARALLIAGVIGLLVSVGLGVAAGDSFKRFLHAYLAAYGYVLSLGLGALFFVIIHHLTKAGWSVNIRRVPEALGATMPLIAILSVPLIISAASNRGTLYPWARTLNVNERHEAARPEPNTQRDAKPAAGQEGPAAAGVNAEKPSEGKAVSADEQHAEESGEQQAGSPEYDHEVAIKQRYLNIPFFLIRMVIYLGLWSLVGIVYWRHSVRQDQDGDVAHSVKLETWAPVLAIATMLTLTFGAVDLLMSLDPLWYSTIFGVYYFAGCAVGIFAFMSLTLHVLQGAGYLRGSVNVDHYHDLGKYLFAFTFFFGYIAFSQYMLQWYGSIPEEIFWWQRHGGTTVAADVTMWSFVLVALLFGKVLIPFGGLLSRHVKRNKGGLIFWAVWQLVFCALDIFWIVMPQLGKNFNAMAVVMYLAALVGIGGVVMWAFVGRLAAYPLRPMQDPRIAESLAYANP